PPADGQDRAGRGFTHLAWPGTLQGAASGDYGAGEAAPDHGHEVPGALPPRPSQDTGQTPAPRPAIARGRGHNGRPVDVAAVGRRAGATGNAAPRAAGCAPPARGSSSRFGPTPTCPTCPRAGCGSIPCAPAWPPPT